MSLRAPHTIAAERFYVRMAIVTTAKRADFEIIHEKRRIRQFMDFVLVREDYKLAKPHPEPYLTAARLLGVEVADCVAIEDSPAGVGSAVAAGVPTIAVPHVVPVPRLAGSVQLPSLRGVRPEDLLTAVAAVAV